MIKCCNGVMTIDGSFEELATELTVIIRIFREIITKKTGDEETANELINHIFDLSMVGYEEGEKLAKEKSKELAKKFWSDIYGEDFDND